MGWEPGQATLRKEGGVWKQNPQALFTLERGSFFSIKDNRKLSQYLIDRGLDEDCRPHVGKTILTKRKWKRKPKKGGEK